MDKSIIELAMAAALVAQTLINLLRMGTDLPRWGPPVGAIIVGIGTVALLALANAAAFTGPAIAQIVLAGILSGGAAVGANELGQRAQAITTARRRG